MKCLCDANFKCSACQEKVIAHGKIFEEAAAFVAGLDEGYLIDFLMEVQMHSPNIEKMTEIEIAAQDVIKVWSEIQDVA